MKKAKDKTKAVVYTPRLCQAEGCSTVIERPRQRWCGPVCKNRYKMIINGHGDVLAAFQAIGSVKYNKEFSTTKLKEYLEECKKQDTPELIPTPKGGLMLINHAHMPTQHGYADFLGFLPSTVEEWVEKIPEFAQAMAYLKNRQHILLANKGLSGQYDARLAILHLTNNHGMKIKTENEHTHKFLGIMKHMYEKADEIARLNKGKKQ